MLTSKRIQLLQSVLAVAMPIAAVGLVVERALVSSAYWSEDVLAQSRNWWWLASIPLCWGLLATSAVRGLSTRHWLDSLRRLVPLVFVVLAFVVANWYSARTLLRPDPRSRLDGLQLFGIMLEGLSIGRAEHLLLIAMSAAAAFYLAAGALLAEPHGEGEGPSPRRVRLVEGVALLLAGCAIWAVAEYRLHLIDVMTTLRFAVSPLVLDAAAALGGWLSLFAVLVTTIVLVAATRRIWVPTFIVLAPLTGWGVLLADSAWVRKSLEQLLPSVPVEMHSISVAYAKRPREEIRWGTTLFVGHNTLAIGSQAVSGIPHQHEGRCDSGLVDAISRADSQGQDLRVDAHTTFGVIACLPQLYGYRHFIVSSARGDTPQKNPDDTLSRRVEQLRFPDVLTLQIGEGRVRNPRPDDALVVTVESPEPRGAVFELTPDVWRLASRGKVDTYSGAISARLSSLRPRLEFVGGRRLAIHATADTGMNDILQLASLLIERDALPILVLRGDPTTVGSDPLPSEVE